MTSIVLFCTERKQTVLNKGYVQNRDVRRGDGPLPIPWVLGLRINLENLTSAV